MVKNVNRRPVIISQNICIKPCKQVIVYTEPAKTESAFWNSLLFIKTDPDQLTHGSAGVLAKRLTRRQAHVDYSGMWSRTSSGLLECKQCSRTFKTWAGLQVHIRQHHLKVFNYVCEKCSKGFMARAHYVGHVNMHNQIKPFKCPRCPMSYFYKQDLRKHFLSKKCT